MKNRVLSMLEESDMLVFAAKHKDELIRVKSRSGGIFTALSDLFLSGGVVYGCVLDENFNARHIRVEDKISRDKMRGSKYIQSQLGDCFKQVKNDLDKGKEVLFSGTSCQIAGLQCYLQKDYPMNIQFLQRLQFDLLSYRPFAFPLLDSSKHRLSN